MYKYHKCDFLPTGGGISIIYDDSLLHSGHHIWHLVIERQATEEDLYDNHYLDGIGDTIWQTVIEIYCCPFCGTTLSPSREKGKADNFIHYDMSNWDMKTC